jgi:hypothetical protein
MITMTSRKIRYGPGLIAATCTEYRPLPHRYPEHVTASAQQTENMYLTLIHHIERKNVPAFCFPLLYTPTQIKGSRPSSSTDSNPTI